MTKKTPKPTPAHMQKLADLMDTRPEGVTTRQAQNALSVSPTLAKAALIEIGAVEVEGKWVFAEVEPEPVTIDWTSAPKDATHFYKRDKAWLHIEKNGELYCFCERSGWLNDPYLRDLIDMRNTIPRPTSTAIPKLKKLTQAEIDACSDTCTANICGALNVCFMDKAPVEPEPVAKSDFALALEAERQRVLDAVANGGTVERIAELAGLHVDDVQMHLDVLIDDGAVVERPVIVAMSYGVAV